MREVPYQANPGNACALACNTMIAQYLLPSSGITFEQLGEIAGWRKDYLVWEFSVWKWLMDRGVSVASYDVFDYHAWAANGVNGLAASVPASEFAWYVDNTYDLAETGGQLRNVLEHNNFSYHNLRPSWEEIVAEYHRSDICGLVLNAAALNHHAGFVAHQVVLIELTADEVVFHDPDNMRAYRKEPLSHFQKVIDDMETPALTSYTLR